MQTSYHAAFAWSRQVNFHKTRQFFARRSEIASIRRFVESVCASMAFPDRQRLVLIVEELFSNSIDHGYGGDSDQPVWLTLTLTADGCHLAYRDMAPAYNPFISARLPVLGTDALNRPEGGLGVFLIGQLSSSRRYERRDEHNHIELFVPRSDRDANTEVP